MAILVIGIGNESNRVVEELRKININEVDINCVQLLSVNDKYISEDVIDVELMGDDGVYFRHATPENMGEELIRKLIDNNMEFIKDLIVASIMEKKLEDQLLRLSGEKQAHLHGDGWTKDKPIY